VSGSRGTLLVFVAGWSIFGAGAAEAGFCLGRNCGIEDPTFHCHSRNSQQNECWDQLDDACEDVPGFRVRAGEATSCSLGGDVLAPLGALGGAQNLTLVGGHEVFRGQLRRPLVTRAEAAERAAEAAGDDDDDDDDGEEDGEADADAAFHFDEMATALEREDWQLAGTDGETLGAHFGWLRQTGSGHRFSAAASYQRADPDGGDAADLVHLDVGYGHTLDWGDWAEWHWGLGATFNRLDARVEQDSSGGTGQLGLYKAFDNGHQLSGGLVLQFLSGSDLDADLKTIGVGAAYGVPIGQRLGVDVELYHVSVLDTVLTQDRFLTAAALVSWYVSPRFGLTLGYRVLEGIDDLDSRTITLGTSSRFD
jgi:hypothetical protein